MDYSTFLETRAHAYELIKQLPGIVVMKGAGPFNRPGTDYETPIVQESNFYYLTGVEEEDAWFVWDLPNNKAHLFFTLFPEEAKMWMKVEDFDEKKKRLFADGYHTIDELPAFVNQLVSEGKVPIQTIDLTTVEDIRQGCKLDASVPVNNKDLMYLIHEARARKTPKEIAVLRKACDASTKLFTEILKKIRPGFTEMEVEAWYSYYARLLGGTQGKFEAFGTIGSIGPHTAILHHLPEDGVAAVPGQHLLIDAGTTFHQYCADITRTYPVSGKYEGDGKWLYETVLMAQKAVIDMMKPGVLWGDCHLKAMQVIGARLIERGIIRAPAGSPAITVDEAIAKDLVAPFFPHGLGHMLGLDTHDVGGYFKGGPERSTRPSFNRLRMNRLLEPGFVVTAEPGCYFNPNVVNPFLREHPELEGYFDMDLLNNVFYKIGGVRIEDDVLVTPTGCEVLTSPPKTIEDVERIMAEAKN